MIATDTNKHTYETGGGVMAWPYTFPIADASDILVYVENTEGDLNLVESGYTVDTEAGEVLYPADQETALAEGQKVILIRAVPITQSVDLQNQGSYDADVHEGSIDRLTLIAADLNEVLSRCIKFPVNADIDEDDVSAASYLQAVEAYTDAAQAAQVAAATSADEASSSASAAAGSAAQASASAIEAAASAAAAEDAAGRMLPTYDTFAEADADGAAYFFIAKCSDIRQIMAYLGDRNLGNNGWISLGGW